VGRQADKDSIDQDLSDLAVQWRTLAQRARNLGTQVNGQGDGLAYLIAHGYDNVTANPDNPGAQTDAAWAHQAVDYFANLEGVYFGTVAQGGDPDATPPTPGSKFNFDSAFAVLWGGQIGP